MSLRRSFALVALNAALVLAACQSDPVAPDAAAGSAVLAHGGRQVRGHWRFNTEKYRDRGGKPTGGRSGSAAIQVEALVGAGGLTVLEVVSYRAGDLSRPAGEIVRVQVKAFGPDGGLLFVRNFGGLDDASRFRTTFRLLPAGARFEVTAHVRGLDGRRTDVVTVGGVAARRAPSLAVTGLTVPAPVVTGTPTIVTATVAELNGETGARADCELKVDGRVADRARGIWVDAGDQVACAFTVVFDLPGRHTVAVALERIRPRDPLRGDDRRAVAVDVALPSVVAGAPSVDWSAAVRWGTTTARDTFAVSWTAPDGTVIYESADGDRADGTVEEAMLTAQIGSTLAFPLARIELRQASGGVLLDQALYLDVPADGGGSVGVDCVSRGVGTGAEFYLCANQLGFSTLTYRRATGTVTYQSSGYTRTWNGASYDVDTWVDNTTDAGPLPVVPLGASYTFDVRVTTGGLTHGFGAVVPLGPVTESQVEPLACATQTIPVDGVAYLVRACSATSSGFTGIAGSANGAGFLGNAPAGLRPTP